eukprot:GHRQ01023412.1.p1 GENE.GHRQ01023412.1~~GHRQ01023412.1.p1  ORF type:complete len:122 (-),score=11.63 GHRQ01023412.1:3-368(-)
MQHTAPASQHRQWLHSALDDELEFDHCLKGLANNKAAGPDDVCNEVFKALPPAGHQALHNMMRIMWATGLNPAQLEAQHHASTIQTERHPTGTEVLQVDWARTYCLQTMDTHGDTRHGRQG